MITLQSFNFFTNLRLIFFLLISLIVLFFVYIDISILYQYQGIFNYEFNLNDLILPSFLLVIIYPLLYKVYVRNTFSSDVVFCLFSISFLPFLVLVSTNKSYSFEFIFLFFLYWFFLLLYEIIIPSIKIESFKRLNSFIPFTRFVVILCLVFSVIFVWYKFTNFRFQFDIINVYSARAEARGYNISFPVSYLLVFADNFLPIFAFYYLVKRNYLIFFFLTFIIFLNFSISGTKQIFFLYLVGFFSTLFISLLNKFRFKDLFIVSIIFLLLLSILELKIFKTGIAHNFFGYRLIYIPSQLHSVFYEFFQTNDFDYFQQGFLKVFFDSDFSTNYQFLIGDFWIGDSSARANNGLFSDAYANIGFFGILILPCILVLILNFMNYPMMTNSIIIKSMSVFYLVFVYLGMSLSNMIFSAGVLPFIFILYLIRLKDV